MSSERISWMHHFRKISSHEEHFGLAQGGLLTERVLARRWCSRPYSFTSWINTCRRSEWSRYWSLCKLQDLHEYTGLPESFVEDFICFNYLASWGWGMVFFISPSASLAVLCPKSVGWTIWPDLWKSTRITHGKRFMPFSLLTQGLPLKVAHGAYRA